MLYYIVLTEIVHDIREVVYIQCTVRAQTNATDWLRCRTKSKPMQNLHVWPQTEKL